MQGEIHSEIPILNQAGELQYEQQHSLNNLVPLFKIERYTIILAFCVKIQIIITAYKNTAVDNC